MMVVYRSRFQKMVFTNSVPEYLQIYPDLFQDGGDPLRIQRL